MKYTTTHSFGASLTKLTDDEVKWLQHALRNVDADEICDAQGVNQEKVDALISAEPWRDTECPELLPDFSHSFHVESDGMRLWLGDNLTASPWSVGELVHAFLKAHRPHESWALTWSTTIETPTGTSFSGGALVATANDVYVLNPDIWIQGVQSRLAGEKRTPWGSWKK